MWRSSAATCCQTSAIRNLVALQMQMRLPRIPSARGQVVVASQRNLHRRDLVRQNADLPMKEAVLRAARDHQVVRTRRDTRLVGPVHVEGLAALDGPERAAIQPDAADLIGEAADGNGLVRRQRQAAGLIVQADASRHRPAGRGILDRESQSTERGRRARRAAPRDGDVAESDDALTASDGHVHALRALPRQARPVQRNRGARACPDALRNDLHRAARVPGVLVVERRRWPARW